MLAPDRVAVVVGRAHPDETIPDLRPPELLLGGLPVDAALEHHVTVVRGARDAPPVLAKEVHQPRDLGEPLGRFGDELTQPAGVAPLPAVGTIQLVAHGPEDVDEDVARPRHAAQSRYAG